MWRFIVIQIFEHVRFAFRTVSPEHNVHVSVEFMFSINSEHSRHFNLLIKFMQPIDFGYSTLF